MAESGKQKLGFLVAAMMMVGALAALNLGTPATAQQEACDPDGGGGGNPSESPSPSPSESEEPFPPSIPPIIPDETESESPSPTETAGGQGRECDSNITIGYRNPYRQEGDRPQFYGRVRSQEDACESGRKVLLKKARNGKRDLTVDTTVTNQRGKWRIPAKRANGKFYAKTPQERVPSDQGRVTCGGDRSKGIRV